METTENPERYQIRIAGVLDESWSDWFGGMEIETETGNQGKNFTVLTGEVADQACLRGVLSRIWDLNLKVISIQPLGAVRRTK
jgi:hypothetical protein